jgi:hypothetical protein
MPIDKYLGASLQRELLDKIEEYVKTHRELGYSSMTDFVIDAVRKRCEELNISVPAPLPRLEHFNLNEDGVLILDRDLEPPHGKIITVYFKGGAIFCGEDESNSCKHVDFALEIPEVQETLRKKGWTAKEGKIIRKPY